MIKVAPNSNFVGRFSEINLHSKIKGPLLEKGENTNILTCSFTGYNEITLFYKLYA